MSPDNAWIGTHTSPSTVAGGHSCSHPLIYAPTLQSKPAMRNERTWAQAHTDVCSEMALSGHSPPAMTASTSATVRGTLVSDSHPVGVT